ncbi:MAG: hypothetical protein RSD19_01410, partial [Oscillospiraceae bacterium]
MSGNFNIHIKAACPIIGTGRFFVEIQRDEEAFQTSFSSQKFVKSCMRRECCYALKGHFRSDNGQKEKRQEVYLLTPPRFAQFLRI